MEGNHRYHYQNKRSAELWKSLPEEEHKRYVDMAKERPHQSYNPWKEVKRLLANLKHNVVSVLCIHSLSNTCKLYVQYCIQNAVLFCTIALYLGSVSLYGIVLHFSE